MISSANPSLKYSLSLSAPTLANGKTAIDGSMLDVLTETCSSAAFTSDAV
jgi:hypothetical protein